VVAAALEKRGDHSPYLNIISDIKLLAYQSRVCNFIKVDRLEVRASHRFANFARAEHRIIECSSLGSLEGAQR
jgi:hypothetical protein